MDERIKKNTIAGGRESRASDDEKRAAPETMNMSSEERRSMFRSEWVQEALPKPPEIPGYHLCWLSTTNSYDPIHKRLRMGYTPVKAEEIKGFDSYVLKSGEFAGFVACNEMLLYKLPMDIYQEIMAEFHHNMPLEEQEKIKLQVEQIQGARDSRGRPLGSIEGDGLNFDNPASVPLFE